MTYSIVADDAKSGELGVAVQTCNLAVGTWVPWAQGGVGAVATQSHADRSYGTLGLALMEAGKSAQQALDALLAADERREFRQVGIVDRYGHSAVHTGSRCLPQAGHAVGDGFSTHANMMAKPTVWQAMAEAYTDASGDLADRLLAALDAAQSEGGDMRGQQSAALLVVDRDHAPFPLVDLRVDHNSQPLVELRRLLQLHRAYTADYAASAAIKDNNLEDASEYLSDMVHFAPHEEYLRFMRAYHLAGGMGQYEAGLELMRGLIADNPVWVEYLRRDVNSNTFDYPGLAAKLLQSLQTRSKLYSKQSGRLDQN